VRHRLREIEQAETRKRAREEARNGLEGYLYSLRDQLEDADFSRASTEPERKAIDKLRGEASDWLSDAAETAPTKDLRSRRHELECVVRDTGSPLGGQSRTGNWSGRSRPA
jgi:hypoxia up-regulated 1